MQATKFFVVLEATAAISLTAIRVAYGFYVSNKTRVNSNSPYTANSDFWGWFSGCLSFSSTIIKLQALLSERQNDPTANKRSSTIIIPTAIPKPKLLQLRLQMWLLGLVNQPPFVRFNREKRTCNCNSLPNC